MRILLLTDIPPNKVYPGALFLDSLCRLLPQDSLVCFCVVNPKLDASVSPDLTWIPIQYNEKPKEQTDLHPRHLSTYWNRLHNLVWESYVSVKQIPRIAEAAIEFGRRQKCDIVWCVLEGQTLIRLARRVADGLGIPLYTQVFDPPYRWLYMHQVNRFSSRRIIAEFEAALRHSKSCATGSWAMAEEYHQKYRVKTVPVVPSLREELSLPAQIQNSIGDTFVIGAAGQLYATEEWKALLDALTCIDWQLAGREVRLWILGHNVQLDAKTKMNVEFFGWRSQEEVITLLSKASILYCSYWFTQLFEASARLSFPSKLVSYLATGRPVLFHGPTYASPHKFLAQHGAGISCHSLKPEDIVESLTRLATDQALYDGLTKAGVRVFREHLTVHAMRRSFAEFLEVDEKFLRSEADCRS
jgi:glycosyltransferase involved in cell wall biosynthesis